VADHVATSVVWFRRDLRVHDHPALRRTVDAGDRVAPLFVVDERLVGGRWRSANRLWFLQGSLVTLAESLLERGAPLTVLRGDPVTLVPAFARAVGAARVVASRDHSPYARRRDGLVATALGRDGIAFEAGRGLLVHEPEQIQRADGGGFSVFGPFHRAWSSIARRPVLDAPTVIAGTAPPSDAIGLARVALEDALPTVRPTADMALMPAPGEASARARLDAWAASGALASYDTERDRLDRVGTSRLSQDLRFGLVSPVEVVERCAGNARGNERYLSEIAWRDFYAHLLAREPRVLRSAFRRELDAIPWVDDAAGLEAWRTGRTGVPVVDAGIRQLLATGWMHNRARMIVASFLAKDLLVDWRAGEAFFMEHLLDGDPASNNGGWQWAASTGTDAQPYFRVFNPVLQGRRHDPDGTYVRTWVPELAGVTTAEIHDPPPAARTAAGYPTAIVDHAAARSRAIAVYAAASAAGSRGDRAP
jgi:deoxyribodipyrimidine photo-lyase